MKRAVIRAVIRTGMRAGILYARVYARECARGMRVGMRWQLVRRLGICVCVYEKSLPHMQLTGPELARGKFINHPS